jgi:hypothetical protein
VETKNCKAPYIKFLKENFGGVDKPFPHQITPIFFTSYFATESYFGSP